MFDFGDLITETIFTKISHDKCRSKYVVYVENTVSRQDHLALDAFEIVHAYKSSVSFSY